jgi:electron transfer flavoprotein alpha subunit
MKSFFRSVNHMINKFSNSMTTLVIADHNNISINSSTLRTVTAAKKLPNDVHLLVAGNDCMSAASEGSKISGVSRVIRIDNKSLLNFRPENVSSAIKDLHNKQKYTHVIAPDTSNGKNYLPRLGALLDVQPISGVIKIVSFDTFVRPIYAGSALATVKSTDDVKLITIRTTAFEEAELQEPCDIDVFDGIVREDDLSIWISDEISKSDRPELSTAKIIVSGGRAMKSAENVTILYSLAAKLGAAVGASRAAVNAGYCSNDIQIGQTVAPQLYFALGISGAIQHLAGMKDSINCCD